MMGRLTVFTARYDFRGSDRFDITIRGAREARKRGQVMPGEVFAPPLWLWSYAKMYTHTLPPGIDPPPGPGGDIFDWYAGHYTAAMRESYRAHRPAWDALLSRETVTLVCFCASANTCHRGVLAKLLVRCGACAGGER